MQTPCRERVDRQQTMRSQGGSNSAYQTVSVSAVSDAPPAVRTLK